MNELQITELNGQRVLTTQQIADGYESKTRTIVDNFNNNRNRFEEGKHFILLEGEYLDMWQLSFNTTLEIHGLNSQTSFNFEA